MALRPSYSTAENLHEENRLLYPKGSYQEIKLPDLWIWTLFKSLPSLRCPSAWSLCWTWTTHTHQKELKWFTWAESSTGTCTESTIPTRGKETQPFGLKPDIILYRYETIYIYIYTATKYIVKRINSADLTLETQQRACRPGVCITGTTIVSTVLP